MKLGKLLLPPPPWDGWVVVGFGVGPWVVVVGVGVGVSFGMLAALTTLSGVVVGLSLDTAGVDEGDWTEEDFCLQRFESWRFLRGARGARGTSRGAGTGAGRRATMALWWCLTTWGVVRALEAARKEMRRTRELMRAIGSQRRRGRRKERI
jgi:hypothetical protein